MPRTPQSSLSSCYKKSSELWYQSDERKRRNRNCRSYLCTERAWMLLSRADAVENRKTIENRSNCFEPRTAFGRSFCALERFLFSAKSVRSVILGKLTSATCTREKFFVAVFCHNRQSLDRYEKKCWAVLINNAFYASTCGDRKST